MSRRCNVCGTPSGPPLYESQDQRSLTSLSTVEEQPVSVFACRRCGHLQTPPLADLAGYYAHSYRILLESEEDDQIYEAVEGRNVFRAEHQARTLLDHLDLPLGARVLDYGAAKGATLRRVLEDRPDLAVHLFDVSEMYRPFWADFLPAERQATFEVPADWRASFDVVVSFFMLEHVEEPVAVLRELRSLLTEGGRLYFVVPNFKYNVADFVVVDHVNHFSESSLRALASASGFVPVLVDAAVHRGALVALFEGSADPPAVDEPNAELVGHTLARADELAAYWSGIAARIKENESDAAGRPAAVYGAGFYGSLVLTSLSDRSNVTAVVDQNPFLQGRRHFDLPIVAPDELPDSVTEVHVGLNPTVARHVIDAIERWRDRGLRFYYL